MATPLSSAQALSSALSAPLSSSTSLTVPLSSTLGPPHQQQITQQLATLSQNQFTFQVLN